MDTNTETTEGERSVPKVYHVLVEKPYGDGHLIIVATDLAAARKKMEECRTYNKMPFRIFEEEELKALMPDLRLYVYVYVNGTPTERKKFFLAQGVDEARNKLHNAVGLNIKIVSANSRKIFH
jgi:hypothetical protein